MGRIQAVEAGGERATMEPTGDFFLHLCEHLDFVVIAVDHDHRICFCNAHAARQFGMPAAQLKGRPFREVLENEDERQRATVCLERALMHGEPSEMRAEYKSGEDENKTFVLIISPITDAGGRRLGASACMRDISARQKMAQQLAEGRRMAALGHMAGSVAHHFNNILGGMLTSIDYVLPSDRPRELRRTLRLLAQSIGRATRITKQLEAFAMSEHGDVEWAALNDLMNEAVRRIRQQAERLGLKLDTDIDLLESRPFETQRLLPVLESIAQNALDAMAPGGTLTLEMHRRGDQAIISFVDTGCGISQEILDRVFEPFFTTKGELAGGDSKNIGLGLSVVHGLVSEMGGTIRMSSKVGAGTKVEVRLPLKLPSDSRGPNERPD